MFINKVTQDSFTGEVDFQYETLDELIQKEQFAQVEHNGYELFSSQTYEEDGKTKVDIHWEDVSKEVAEYVESTLELFDVEITSTNKDKLSNDNKDVFTMDDYRTDVEQNVATYLDAIGTEYTR